MGIFKYDIYFKRNWQNGLEMHMARKHCDIEQVDGNNTFDDDDKYTGPQHYWKTGRLGTVFQSSIELCQLFMAIDVSFFVKLE